MSNLFSIFDSSGLGGLQLSWGVAMVPLLVVPSTFWLGPGAISAAWRILLEVALKEFKRAFSREIRPGTPTIMVNLFAFIGVCNLISLMPFVFTPSSHLRFSMSLAFPLWLGYILFWGTKRLESLLAHLVPRGTPVFLISFMVLIEVVRSVIRPLTLSVRLAANMIAGHLLLCLLGTLGTSLIRSPLLLLVLTGVVLLVTLEFAVALIQAYVFRLLRSLYVGESSPNEL